MDNDIAQQEIEALKAIFSDDYSQEIKIIRTAWKQPINKIYHCLHLVARENGLKDHVSVDFCFSYNENYPNEFYLRNFIGVGSAKQMKLQDMINEKAVELLQEEMIFELANLISDYITEHNLVSDTTSSHTHMEINSKMEHEKVLMELERKKDALMEQKLAENTELAQQVSKEIERKQLLLKEEKMKRKKDVNSIPRQVLDTNFTPKLSNCIICPVKMGQNPSTQHAWFAETLGTMFSIETYELGIVSHTSQTQIDEQLQSLKKYKHTHAPIVYDYDIIQLSDTCTIRLLTSNYRNISIANMLHVSKSLPIGSSSSVLAALLSVSEDCKRLHLETGSFDLGDLWFDENMNIVISTIFYLPSIMNLMKINTDKLQSHWNIPVETSVNDISLKNWYLGVALLRIVSPDISKYQSPFDCASSVIGSGPNLISMVKMLMEPKLAPHTNPKDLLYHPFITSSEHLEELNACDTKEVVDLNYFHTMPQRVDNPISRYQADFEEIEFLGKGGFGSVVKAKNRVDGRFYAIKRVKLNTSDVDHSKRLLREVQTLSRLHSEYIVRYYQAWFEENDNLSSSTDSDTDSLSSQYSGSEYSDEYEEDTTDDWLSSGLSLRKLGSLRIQRRQSSGINESSGIAPPLGLNNYILYIQMEYCEKKTLRDGIEEGISIDFSWKYFRQSLEGLGHLHAQGIIHRDLKPSNIFLDRTGRIKIGDFGLATEKKGSNPKLMASGEAFHKSVDELTSEVGTPVYIAPEIMSEIGRYNSKVDMYSLGIVFFEMIYKMNTSMQRSVVLDNLRSQDIIFPDDFAFENMKNQALIIRNLLNHVPRERYSCTQLLHSPLIPANVEDEYINEDLLRVVRQRNPVYFSRLISALFGQVTDIHKDFAYDFNSNNNTLNTVNSLVSSLVDSYARKVFLRHGAVQICPSIFIPKSEIIDQIYTSKKPAEFLDRNGDIVQLMHDQTVPFARSIAQNSDENVSYPLKRYSIERVFRNNPAGGQPKSIEECDFDIIYSNTRQDMVPEAEVIKTVFEILEFGHMHNFHNISDYVIRVNYMQNYQSILTTAGVPTSLFKDVSNILAQLYKPLNWNQVKVSLMKLGLDKAIIERLVSQDTSSIIDHKTKKIASHLLEYNQKLIQLKKNLDDFGVTNTVSFDPLLVYHSQVFGKDLVFQIARKIHSKFDVIAAGGRYETLLNSFIGPFNRNLKKLNAVGVNVAFSKLISNMSEIVYQSRFEEKVLSNYFVKADVIVVGLADSQIIRQSKLSIVNELWNAGISTEVSFVCEISEFDEHLPVWKFEYTYAVILKPKGNESFIIKVRNLVTKTEIEVQRSGLVNALQVPKLKREVSMSSINEVTESDSLKHNVIVIPLSNKKSKYKGHTGIITEKCRVLLNIATQAVSAILQRSPIITVEMNSIDIEILTPYWLKDEDTFKKAHHKDSSSFRDYTLLVKKQIQKCFKNGAKMIFIYCNIDTKVIPITF